MEDVAGEALGVDADEHVLGLDLAPEEREVRAWAAQALAVGDRQKSPYAVGSRTCKTRSRFLVPPPVLDQVGDREQLDLVPLAERDEIRHAGLSRPRS